MASFSSIQHYNSISNTCTYLPTSISMRGPLICFSMYLFSFRTVEVNNTDAEGRLVLGDGVRSVSVNINFV